MTSKIMVKFPIGIQWKIAAARLQELRNSINGRLKSETFDIPGTNVQYLIRIYPNGNGDERRGQTLIYFYLSFKEKKEIESEFVISIESANYFNEQKYVYKETVGWAGKAVCTVDELFDPEKRFIVAGEMIIKVKGFLMIEKDANILKIGFNGNFFGINLWNQENKDFTIVADGKEITAHKLILSACSPVFQGMFKSHTMEAQKNKVIIPDFSFTIVETAIKLCYDSRLVEDIPIEDQILLLQFFDKYDIQMLKIDLENLMITVMDESNVCRFANAAIISNALNLKEKCGKLLQKCFRENQLVNDLEKLDKEFTCEMLLNSLLKISL